MGFPVVTTCPPFSPCTKSDFFSAIAILKSSRSYPVPD
jgi:hypothetical protein